MLRNLGEKYSPLYFLAALGLGGMATFFFMIFMFITPHPDTPIPTLESIMAAWAGGSLAMQVAIVVGYVGLITFVLLHLRLMVWNLREFAAFQRTEAFPKLRDSNGGVALMAVPLSLAMTVNTMFVSGATLVPGLWNVIEYLMPAALAVFALIGIYALRVYGRFARHIFSGKFNYEANTGLNQLLGAFAFAMVGVGMAAGSAMSSNIATATAGWAGSIFFATASMLVFAAMLPLGVKSMLRYGLSPVNSATLWLPVPIITLLGITFVRNSHGAGFFEMNSAREAADLSMTVGVVLTVAVAAQVIFLLFGNLMMKSNGYYADYVLTKKHQSPVAFTLVCPGVALGVLGFFALHSGLVGNGIVTKFSMVYFALLAVLWLVQIATIALVVVLLKNQIFRGNTAAVPVAPEKSEAVASDLVGAAR